MLFLVNGVVEAFVAILLYLKPTFLIDPRLNREIHPDGKVMTDMAATLLFVFSIASIMMHQLSDEDNDAKLIFAVSWLIYHLIRAMIYFHLFAVKNKSKKLIPALFHAFMMSWFVKYYYFNYSF